MRVESGLCVGFTDTHFPTESIAFSISDIFSNFFGSMKNTKKRIFRKYLKYFRKFLKNRLNFRKFYHGISRKSGRVEISDENITIVSACSGRSRFLGAIEAPWENPWETLAFGGRKCRTLTVVLCYDRKLQ